MDGTVSEYRVTPSIASGEKRYRIEGEVLVFEWAKRGERRSHPLADVVRVRLTCIQGVGRCELHTRAGAKLVIISRSFRGVGDFIDQARDYNAFIAELHARLADAAPKAQYLGGTSFGFALGVLAVVCGAVAALIMLISAGIGDLKRAAMMLAPLLGALAFGVPIMLAGRARPYRPDALPREQLPG